MLPKTMEGHEKSFLLGLRTNRGDLLRQWPKSNVERKICNNWHNIR